MNRKCPICSSNNKKSVYRKVFGEETNSITPFYDVTHCVDCGFTFADNIPSQKEYDDYYENMSKYEFTDIENYASDHFIQHANNVFTFLKEGFLDEINNKDISILDIGCSTGSLLKVFKDNNYSRLYGIDPSPICVKTVRDIHNIEADAYTISNFNNDKKFNLITLSAVLEHVIDLKDTILKISRMQNYDDYLFIDVPNLKQFSEYIFVAFQQFNSEHVNYFSIESIRNLLALYEYEIILHKEHNVNRTKDIIEPDLFIIAQKKFNLGKIYFDHDSFMYIIKYINECQKKDNVIKNKFYDKVKNIDKLIIWGVGEHSKWLLNNIDILDKIIYFVDNNKKVQNNLFLNKRVKCPERIKEDYPIFISSWAHQDEILDFIKNELRLKNNLITLY